MVEWMYRGYLAMSDNNFVVYAYVRSKPDRFGREGTFYYIGKGRPGRPYSNLRSKNARKPKNDSRILILHKNLDEKTAIEFEISLISFYGRADLHPWGVLRNLTDGGEGSSGVIVSEETRKKMSESRLGDKNYNYKPRDWYHSEHGEVLGKSPRELCEMFLDMNLDERCLGGVYRREKTNHKGWRRLDDKDVKHRRKNNISRDWFHEEHGVVKDKSLTELIEMFPNQNLSIGALSLVANGKNIHHKGWHLLENKNKKRKNYKPINWYHPVHGVIFQKTGPELVSMFPDQKLDSRCLNKVTLGKANHHRGWVLFEQKKSPPYGELNNKPM